MELRIRCLSAGYSIMIWAVTFARVRPFTSPFARHLQRLPCLHPQRGFHRMFSTLEGTPEPMENLYQAWTVEQDQFLFDNRKESLPKLAAMTGRGLRGVEARLAKLKDVDSAAYMRLWAGQECVEVSDKETKLVPANEVLRRIQWDHSLTESDFSVLHYDRIEDKVMESPMDAPNKSVSGKATLFVLAIPEHRIVGIKYKEQIVWDKEQRIDRVFGSMNGRGETIAQVMANYDQWKERKNAADELDRQRQIEVSNRVQQILGDQRYVMLRELSSSLRNDQTLLTKKELEAYVNTALQLFRDARGDPGQDPSIVPSTDEAALDAFSELVAMLPDPNLRPAILTEISSVLKVLEVKSKSSNRQDPLPELDEEDLTETFVRGSGAGGQKINKTSNKVVLVHEPTQLRVECQDTRSLSHNRKIARKRLREKLDEHLNGSQSKAAIKATEVALKKAKSKTRNKSRQRKKKGAAGDSNDED